MLEKLERFNRRLSRSAEGLGLAATVFMVALTCVDVIGAKLWLKPVPGSLDMMMLAQLLAVSLAGAGTMLERRHVSVDFFVALLSKPARARIGALVSALGLVLFVVVTWRLFAHAGDLQQGHEVTPTAAIPLAPFTYVAALAMVPLCLVLLHQCLRFVLGTPANES